MPCLPCHALQAKVDYHLDPSGERLYNFIDSVSFPNTQNPLANVEPPSRALTGPTGTFCDSSFEAFVPLLGFESAATYYLYANNTAFTNTQKVTALLRDVGAVLPLPSPLEELLTHNLVM